MGHVSSLSPLPLPLVPRVTHVPLISLIFLYRTRRPRPRALRGGEVSAPAHRDDGEGSRRPRLEGRGEVRHGNVSEASFRTITLAPRRQPDERQINPRSAFRELPFMTSALRTRGGGPDKLRELRKGGCVKTRGGGGQKIGKLCGRQKWRTP